MPELLIVIIVLVAVLSVAATTVVLRRRRGPELEPPAAAPPVPRGRIPAVGEADTTVDTAVEAPDDVLVDEPPVVVEDAPVEPAVVEAPPRLRDRLGKARSAFSGYLGSVLGRSAIDSETWDELEDALIRADVGVTATMDLLDHLRQRVDDEKLETPEQLLEALKVEMKQRVAAYDRSLSRDTDEGRVPVWLVVGVNGAGKTTTIGKLAAREAAEGRSVLVAAGDTFRAAAAEQLHTWAERTGADYVRGAEGGDPSSVIFDGVQRAASRGHQLVLADTAGRLHTKVNLMEELSKVRRVADREPGQVAEVLLVIDATTGQNGLMQAKQFAEAAQVTGVVLTKLDGSARGGIVVAIQAELGIPVKLVGVGETVADLIDFDPDDFVEGLVATE
jgi:fused signal recognition particle receptor